MKARYDVYERLRDLRGLSDYKVVEATGIPRSTFSDWRTGRSAPGIEKILKLVRFFEVNYYDFFGEEASRTMFEKKTDHPKAAGPQERMEYGYEEIKGRIL